MRIFLLSGRYGLDAVCIPAKIELILDQRTMWAALFMNFVLIMVALLAVIVHVVLVHFTLYSLLAR